MASWFSLDGIDSEEIGIHVLEQPAIVVPQRRVKTFEIPGAENAYVFDGDWGYEDVEKEVHCTVDTDIDPTLVASYLTPSAREIVFGNEEDFCYHGYCANAVEILRCLRGRDKREFTARFICSPFKFLAYPDDDIELTESDTIEHPGTARCYPKLRIVGSGSVTVTLHAVDDFTLNMGDSLTTLIVDSAAMVVTNPSGTVDRSRRMNGDYPWLDPGDNLISWTGNVTKIVVTPRFAWL